MVNVHGTSLNGTSRAPDIPTDTSKRPQDLHTYIYTHTYIHIYIYTYIYICLENHILKIRQHSALQITQNF